MQRIDACKHDILNGLLISYTCLRDREIFKFMDHVDRTVLGAARADEGPGWSLPLNQSWVEPHT
jgi:hypothetical protein